MVTVFAVSSLPTSDFWALICGHETPRELASWLLGQHSCAAEYRNMRIRYLLSLNVPSVPVELRYVNPLSAYAVTCVIRPTNCLKSVLGCAG